MNGSLRTAIAAACTALLWGCGSPAIRPAPELLAEWTTDLRTQQPEDAFAAVYHLRSRHLIFIGAKHSSDVDSRTFRLIDDAYALFDIDTVIVEGSPTSRGANSERLLAYAAEAKVTDGFQQGGETIPVVLGAASEKATLWGGEPDDADIKARVTAQGISAEDLLGFYTLRSLPQWTSERRIDGAADPRLRPLVEEELVRNRARLSLDPDVLPGYPEWASWYRATNAKEIAGFVNEEVGPLADGGTHTNRIAAAISRARAAHLHELILSHLRAGETLLVVFGGSHLMIHRPALDAVLGAPCYAGVELRDAPASCGM